MMRILRRFFLYCSVLLVWGVTWGEAFAQGQHWVRSAGGATTDEATDVSIDSQGNTYTTGHFTSAASFGSITLSSSGVTDAFISKTDPNGFFLWAIKAGGTGSDRALSIKTDATGNSYITGFFYGTATFGTQALTSNGVQDVFVAKYDQTGAFVWATSAGGAGSDIGNAVNVDNSGNVVITGEFAGTATFGSQSLTSMNGSVDVFTAKLDDNGNFLWAKKGSAHLTDRGIDVAFDPTGNVYVTGQFTDTITFDNTHFNNTFNAIFVLKYNGSGSEQWFRRIGAGAMNVVSGIAVDASSNVFITGDFTGNVIFFGTPNTTLTHAYPNRIFLAKYSSSGSLLWTHADGSEGELTSRNLTLDASGDPYIVGNYKCTLSSFSDEYGSGIFNSIGNWDLFAAKYTSAGQWDWSRTFGGRQADFGNGIAVNSAGKAIVVGSYSQQLFIPQPQNFEIHETYNYFNGPAYCGDNFYQRFRALTSAGNSDALIANIFDTDREPYDYYRRTGSGCDREYVGVCIGGSACPDTIAFCGAGLLTTYSNTITAGPSFSYLWSTGSGATSINVNQSGYYSVVQTSQDGCFVSHDSVYVMINQSPPLPLISDNLVVNFEELTPDDLTLCSPDSVLLTGSGFGTNVHGWNGPDSTSTTTIWASEPGYYSFYYQDASGCLVENTIAVFIDSLFPPIVPELRCWEDVDRNDSISICEGEPFLMLVYDTITNPLGALACIPYAEVTWSASPSTIDYAPATQCTPSLTNAFIPSESGEYLIQATVLRRNYCDTDLVTISRSIYVELLPVPNIGPLSISIIGETHVCPGDSSLLVATVAPNYIWSGPGVTGVMNDSVWVFLQGNYSVSTSIADTNQYGCSAEASATATVFVQVQSQPIVTTQPSNAVICPNGSVVMSCSGSGNYQWQGPSGPIGGNSASVSVNTPGIYYCIRSDQYGCELVSNSIEVEQYATPFLLAGGVPILCEGESISLSAVTNPGSAISWQSPLSGNDPMQTVAQAGIYTCLVTSCGIETETSITILASQVAAMVSVVGPATVCEGDSVMLQANPGQSNYQWHPDGPQGTEWVVHESGSYSVSTQDANGCNAQSAPMIVTMVPNNVPAPIVNDTAICPGGYAILNAHATGTVFWYENLESETSLQIGPTYITSNLTEPTTYFVQQKSSYCPGEKVPVQVDIDDCEGIEVSNVFSPNGDGINDVFYFPQKGGTCFRCYIYNRWGRLLYEWEDQNQGWDGTIQKTGAKVQDGVYYYLLNYCDYQEKAIREAGFLHVLGSR